MRQALTSYQLALWTAIAARGADDASHTGRDVPGDWDSAAVRAAWSALVRRHGALRARFDELDGVPYVEVRPTGDVDMSDAPLDRAFDLANEPLLRVRLQAGVMRVRASMVALDERSLDLLMAEFDLAYRGVAFAEQVMVSSAASVPSVASVPLPWLPSGPVGTVQTQLPAVAAIAAHHHTTPLHILATALGLTLHLWCGEDLIWVQQPGATAGGQIGCLDSPTTTRLQFAEDPTFSWLLASAAPGPTGVPIARVRHGVTAEFRPNSPRYEWELVVVDGAELELRFDAGRHAQSTATALLDRLVELVHEIDTTADCPASARQRVSTPTAHALAQWNATTTDYSSLPWIHDAFRSRAAANPDAVALRSEGSSVTYREVARRVDVLAGRLCGHGIGPGSTVGIALDPSPELVVALLATMQAGAAYLPLDPDYPIDRLDFMIKDSGTAAVISLRRLADQWYRGSAPVMWLDDPYSGPELPARPQVSDATAAYVIYTSGSTGRPKGAVVTHAGLRNRIAWMQAHYQLTPADAVLQKTPSSFDVSVWEFFWPLTVGATMVLARPGGHRDMKYLAELMAAENVTTVHFVPSVLRLFLAEPHAAKAVSLLRMFCSGEALPAELAASVLALLPCAVHNLYGPTEASVDVTRWECRADEDAVPIGVPVANTTIQVLDTSGRQVPVRALGEIMIGGVQVATGYLGRAALTATRFVPDPYSDQPGARLFLTGDLGKWRWDGAVEYAGRLDHQLKLHGNRVELGEIEDCLASYPGVESAAVTVATISRTNSLIAHVAPTGLDPAALVTHMRQKLPTFMVPSRAVVHAQLPLSPSGKTDRLALMASDNHARTGRPAPRPLERTVTRVVAAVLGRQVGVDDELVLDGLSVLRLRHHLRRAGLEVSVAQLLHTTPAGIACVAAEQPAVTPSPLTPSLLTAPPTTAQSRTDVIEVDHPYDELAFRGAMERLMARCPAVAAGRITATAGDGSFRVTLAHPGFDRWSVALVFVDLMSAYLGAAPELTSAHTIVPEHGPRWSALEGLLPQSGRVSRFSDKTAGHEACVIRAGRRGGSHADPGAHGVRRLPRGERRH